MHRPAHTLEPTEVFALKKQPDLNFIFIDPNSPSVLEQTLRSILLEKLLSSLNEPQEPYPITFQKE